jgi:hypothetical protein
MRFFYFFVLSRIGISRFVILVKNLRAKLRLLFAWHIWREYEMHFSREVCKKVIVFLLQVMKSVMGQKNINFDNRHPCSNPIQNKKVKTPSHATLPLMQIYRERLYIPLGLALHIMGSSK